MTAMMRFKKMLKEGGQIVSDLILSGYKFEVYERGEEHKFDPMGANIIDIRPSEGYYMMVRLIDVPSSWVFVPSVPVIWNAMVEEEFDWREEMESLVA